jgi:hypothetical protein
MSLSSIKARLLAATALVLCAAGQAAAAETRIFSYDPVNEPARVLAYGGLTFVFRKSAFGGTRVLKVISTRDQGSAELKQASEKDLGPGGIDGVLGRKVPEHDLYEIDHKGQGDPLIRAACPGSDHGWLAFGPLRANSDLVVHAFGRTGPTGKAHLCASLQFTWHGEWKLPER